MQCDGTQCDTKNLLVWRRPKHLTEGRHQTTHWDTREFSRMGPTGRRSHHELCVLRAACLEHPEVRTQEGASAVTE